LPEAKQQVNDKQHQHQMAAEYGRHFQMRKTFLQPLFQLDPLQQLLKDQ
jgi:hypothetical protein